MTTEQIARLTDEIYRGLFGAGGSTLRKRLGLPKDDTPDDDNLRDEMGIEALKALMDAERDAAVYIRTRRNHEWRALVGEIKLIARRRGDQLRDEARLKGVDPLTGRPVETRRVD